MKIMKCFKCANEATVKYPNGDVCNDCFIEIMTNRVKKEIRADTPFKKDERVLVFGALAKLFFDKIVEGMPLKVTESTDEYDKSVLMKDFPQYDKIVVPWTADDEAEQFYKELTKSKPNFAVIGSTQKFVKIFKSVSSKELKQAAQILQIPFEDMKKDETVEKIQKKYPSAVFGLTKSAAEFKKAIQ